MIIPGRVISHGRLGNLTKKMLVIVTLGYLDFGGSIPPIPTPSTGSGVGRNKYPKPNTYHPITFVPDYRQAKREDEELIQILKAITKIL